MCHGAPAARARARLQTFRIQIRSRCAHAMAVAKKRRRAGRSGSSKFLQLAMIVAAYAHCGAGAVNDSHRRRAWWIAKLQVRAPNLTDARGDEVARVYYGRASNYGLDHANLFSGPNLIIEG